MIAEYLMSQNRPVAILSRGYKRKNRSDTIVHPNENTDCELVGDEPAMMHTYLPETWMGISANRIAMAANLCQITPTATVFLLDDGFQHRKLRRDLDIVCIDESTLSDRLLPEGYLREPLTALKRADALFLIGSGYEMSNLKTTGEKISERFPDIPLFILVQEPTLWINAATGEHSATLPYKNPIAFSGIARPHRFFNLLRDQGIVPKKELVFPDHHNYSEPDIKFMHELYSQGVVTTEKDAMRLLKVVIKPEFWYLKIKLKFIENSLLKRFNKLIEQKIKL